ncbi:MAG: haloacid dehalogenase type II [Pseudomonadota bacterium]
MRTIIFDAYGTLFDVTAPTRMAGFGDLAGPVSDLWRTKQLQYTWLRTIQGLYADFETVTRDALDHAMAQHGMDDVAKRDAAMAAYRALPLFDDALTCLEALDGDRLVILSNGTGSMLADILAKAGVAKRFDAVLSADTVGLFKPAAPVYAMGPEQLGIEAEETFFISSNGWDIAGSSAFGYRAIWINRAGLAMDRMPAEPEHTLDGLTGLPALMETL